MAIDVMTQDSNAVTDSELEEMADLCVESPNPFSIGLLSKQTERWVLTTLVHDGGRLKGYAFSTLERIGGTPSVLIGLTSIAAERQRRGFMLALTGELFHRALMAFPDEDVLFGALINDPRSLWAFDELADVVPRDGHRANGEERAWGRRLARRFAIPNSSYDDRTFRAAGDGDQPCVVDCADPNVSIAGTDVAEVFGLIDVSNGDVAVVHGWLSPERLVELGS